MGQVTVSCRAGLGQQHPMAEARQQWVKNYRMSRFARFLTPSSLNTPGMKDSRKRSLDSQLHTPLYTGAKRCWRDESGYQTSMHRAEKVIHSLTSLFGGGSSGSLLCAAQYARQLSLEDSKHFLALPMAREVQHSTWHTVGPQSVLAESVQQQ